MRIAPNKLRKHAAAAKVSTDQLAEALVEPRFKLEDARRAVSNWMAGADHPRCKKSHIDRLAKALGVGAKDICKFTSLVKWHRGSPRKARLLAELIRGKSVEKAEQLLTFNTKRAAVNIRKALLAAREDAMQSEADVTALFVTESRVDEGPRMKRFHPKDRGRAHAIIKPFSHITVSVEERVSAS